MPTWPPAGLPAPYYSDAAVYLVHGDARDLLPHVAPSSIALVCTDPPYGEKTNVDNHRFVGGTNGSGTRYGKKHRLHLRHRKPIQNDDKPFDPACLLHFRRLVLWGAQYYASRLHDSGGWLVWDKRQGIEESSWPLSEAELAWTNICNGVHMFRHRWHGLVRATERSQHYHPTQKPVALMRWILERWTKPGDVILDPYAGSGPVAIAAKETGRKCVCSEIDEEYCAIIVKRLAQESLPFPQAQEAM